jgi:hypothetical protein
MDERMQRFVELLEKDELRELVILYAHRIVTQDWRGIAELFTEDGILDYSDIATLARPAAATTAQRAAGSDLVFVGRQAIADFLPAVGRLEVKAFFTNHLVRVTGDDAVGICFFDNRVTQGGASVIGAGRMFDEYRRVAGRWRLAYRRQELFYFTGLHEGWAEGPDRHRPPTPIARRGWEAELIAGWGARS